MSITFLDTINNGIPVAILEAKDIKGSILIDPDPNLPASFLHNSAILNRENKTLTFHDAEGHIIEVLDLTPTDVDAIDAALEQLTTDVTAAQERADSAHNVGVGAAETGAAAMAEAMAAAALGADNRIKIAEHTVRIDEHAALITANRISAETALERSRATDIALNETNEGLGELTNAVETNFNNINTLDEGMVGNNQAIVALDQNLVTLSGTVGENSAKISINEAAIAALDVNNILKIGEDIEVASISSNGSFFMDEMYIPPENQEAGSFTEVKGEYAFKYGDKGIILSFDDVVMDLKGKKLTGLHIPTESTDAIRKAEFDLLSEKVNTNESGIIAVNTELTNQSSQISSLQTTALIKGVDADVDSTKFSVRNKPIKDIVDGTDESDAVSKKQLDQLNTALTARIDGIETGGGVDLSGYAQLDSNVSFNEITANNNHADAINNFKVHVSGEQNTILDLVGNTYINTHAKDSSDSIRSLYIDIQGRSTFANNIKVSQIHGQESWTNISSNEGAKYIKFDEDNKVQIGAHSVVDFSVNGNTPLTINQNDLTFGVSVLRSDSGYTLQSGNVDNIEITSAGLKIHRDVDVNTQNLKKVGDIEIESNRIILGKSSGNLKIRNADGLYRNESDENNSIKLENNAIIYASDSHNFSDNAGSPQLTVGTSVDIHSKQIKHVSTGSDNTDAVNLQQVRQLISDSSSEQAAPRVLSQNDITPQVSSSNKQMTLNMIASMPNGTTLIAYHNPSMGNGKYKFVTNGSTGSSDEKSTFMCVIHKHEDGHATGIGTTEGAGRVYSRALDGTSGIWQTVTTTSTFSLAEDIPDDTPEGFLCLTDDQGIVETYIDDQGDMQIRQVLGYNVPELESEINELQEHKDNNAPLITYFKNSNQITVPYTHVHPTVKVQILDTAQPLQDTSLTLLDDDSGLYSGVYNNVGALSIGSSNTWITNYVYHNAYKHVTANYYVVYDQSITNWVILSTDVLHNTANTDVGSSKINLNQTGTLPESTGSHTITLSVSDINSIEFADAIADTRIDEENKQVIVKFGSVYPSGKIIIS